MDFKDKDYVSWISEIKQRYKNAQIKASIRVNEELLRFYYRLGEDIANNGFEGRYGTRFYEKLSGDIRREIPDARGFSPTTLKYIKYFYERYSPLFRFSQQLSKSEVVRTNRSHLEHGEIDSIDKLFFKKSNQIESSAKICENIDHSIRNENRQQVADDLAVDKIVVQNSRNFGTTSSAKKKIDDGDEDENRQKLVDDLAVDNIPHQKSGKNANLEISANKSVIAVENIIAQQVAVQLGIDKIQQLKSCIMSIPWGHHMVILSKCTSLEESSFYITQSFENGWSRAVLQNFIKSHLFDRQGKATTNFATTLSGRESDLAQALTRDPYVFNFLTIDKRYKERTLKEALIDNVENFLLELGNGFAFLGKEKRIEVGEKEKFLDMLFYNMNLHCYVVVEIKVEEFDSENLGQIGLYVSEVDRQFRKEGDHPTIGLLIVASKDELFAKYALNMVSVPIGIAEYKLTNLLPDELKDDLPSIEEIEKGIR